MGGRRQITDRPNNIRTGAQHDSKPPKFHEAITRPAMPVVTKKGLAARQKPLHDTIPEMRVAKLLTIRSGLESEASTERWSACTHLNTMIEATPDEKDLKELVGIALGAFEGEKDPNVIFSLLDCFIHATTKGVPLASVLGTIVQCLDGDENAEIRKSVIVFLETETFMNRNHQSLPSSLLRLLTASTSYNNEFIAKLRSPIVPEAKSSAQITSPSATAPDGRYLITTKISTSDFVIDPNPTPTNLARCLTAESLVLRRRVMTNTHFLRN